MKIAYNPLGSAAYIPAADNKDLIFDLVTRTIYVKGIPFDGTKYSTFKKHTSPDNTGGSEGLVPIPSYSALNNRLLREDGLWVLIAGVSAPDDALSLESTNSVENKVITKKFNEIIALLLLKAEHVYKNIVINGVLLLAQGANDTLTIIQGDGITLTPNSDNKSITISTKALGLLGISTSYIDGQLVVKVDDLYFNHWNEVFNWYQSVTEEDTDLYINKWLEIVDFLNNVQLGTNILDEFVTRKTDQTIIGTKTFSLQIISTVAEGTSPFVVDSSTRVLKLNADMVDDYHIRKWFNNASDIDNSSVLWLSNGECSDIPSMSYSALINVIGDTGRRWQIWNSRNNHQLYWRPELPDMSEYAPEHILLDSLNYKGFIELMYWADILILSEPDSTTIPTLGGATINGNTIINGPQNALRINSSCKSSYAQFIQMLNPNMSTSYHTSLLAFGYDQSAYNLGYIGFRYVGNDSTSNMVTIGLHSADHILNVLANGNVGICTTTPSERLHISGGMFLQEVNNQWITPARLQIGRKDTTVYSDRAVVGVTDGNLHIDAYKGKMIYLNYYQQPSTLGLASTAVIIDALGNTGIGVTPYHKLHVNGTTWIDAGSYVANRATLVLNSNGAPADIIFKDKSLVSGNYGHWALSSRSGEASTKFAIYRGHENTNIPSELEVFTLRPDGDVDIRGTLNLWNTTCTQNHDEGIRIHASSAGWNALVFCGTDNTGDIGTSAKTWGIYTNKDGNIYINKNSSSAVTAAVLCNVSNNWGIGTVGPADKLDVAGIIRSTANSRYLRIGPQNSSHAHYETNADISHWFNKRVDVNGAIWRYGTNYGIDSDGSFYAKVVYANIDGSSTGGGVSLYSNSDPMTYGIAFRGTGTYGTHGYVTSANDWATYLTMNDSTTRGWIFRRGSTNVASIAGNGNMAIGQHLKFSNEAHISTNRSTDYHYGYTFNLTDNEHSIGMYSGPIGEAGGVVISPDGCLIYNSADCGYNLQVRDKDLGADLTAAATLTFGIEQSGYYAWSRGGFKKNGSSDSYVLLGGGGHKAESSLSVNYANSAGSSGSSGSLYTGSIGSGGDSHASALRNYFNSYKTSIPRNSTISLYSSAYSNGSQYMGYFLGGYNDTPYGGFFVAHYDACYYVGISYGSYNQQAIITSNNIGSQSVNYANSAGTASAVIINYNNNSNSTYQMLWGSGNYVYGTGGIYCNPYTDYLYAGSFYCGSWFRSSGTSGWYSESYGGGIYMEDSTWVRIYNGKKFYVSNGSNDAIHSAGGVYVAGCVHAYANYLKSTCNGHTVTIGSLNSSWCHIETSAPLFYFNKNVQVDGHLYEYSDIRKKNIIQKLEDIDLSEASVIQFKWKHDPKEVHVGVIALEIEEIVPEVVNTDPDGYKSVDYGVLGTVSGVIAIKKISKLLEKIESLEKEIENLKNKN